MGNIKKQLEKVFNITKLRILNSDDNSDSDLDFETQTKGLDPYDHYSIIIGGNKLARGLTIEGLCISYYTRGSQKLLEDTVLQRERWFGYRGRHIQFCRVFLPKETYDYFQNFHNHQIDLRKQFLRLMKSKKTPKDIDFRVLHTSESLPTGRLDNSNDYDINFSGSDFVTRYFEMGNGDKSQEFARKNESLFSRKCKTIVEQGESLKGTKGSIIRDVDVDEIIDLLEGFRFSFHSPGKESDRHVVFQNQYINLNSGKGLLGIKDLEYDPYSIAAYLRIWKKAFFQEGFECKDSLGIEKWKKIPPPKFNLAVRYGSKPKDALFPFPLVDREIVLVDDQVGCLANTAWGSQNIRNRSGDKWIDDNDPVTDFYSPREKGSSGLCLIYIVSKDAKGRNGQGKDYNHHRPVCFLSIPEGGPRIQFYLNRT